jgi:hypothetical protein
MQVRFAVLRCTAAGIGATTAGLLWAESVAGEVAVSCSAHTSCAGSGQQPPPV